MQVQSIRLSLLSVILSAAAIPAMAGNYAEGDPRPVGFTGCNSRRDACVDGNFTDGWLSISDAIRLLMLRIADERRLPFDVKVPNAITRKAIAELEAGKDKRFASVEDLMADLHADD